MAEQVKKSLEIFPATKSEARPEAENIVSDAVNDAVREADGLGFVPNSKKTLTNTTSKQSSSLKPSDALLYPEGERPVKKQPPRRPSESLKTPQAKDEFHTPPEAETPLLTPGLGKSSTSKTITLFQRPKQNQEKPDSDSKEWHKTQVEEVTGKPSLPPNHHPEDIELGSLENAEETPLLAKDEKKDDIGMQGRSKADTRGGGKTTRKLLKFFNGSQVYMSSKFSNRDFRHHFVSKMLMYKAIHMLCGYLGAMLFQMTWTWEREINNLGPPDLVRIVGGHLWVAYIVLVAYLGLALAVRVFGIGRKMPFTMFIYIAFVAMFTFKCYAICVPFGQLVAAIVTTLTITLCLSYCVFSILFTLNKWPDRIDLMSNRIYAIVPLVVICTSPLGWLLNYLELKITDSTFQKEIGFFGSFLEDYLPSAISAYVVLLWEVYRMKRILEGSLISLPTDDEYLYASFFI